MSVTRKKEPLEIQSPTFRMLASVIFRVIAFALIVANTFFF
jgi:hypothetical protein